MGNLQDNAINGEKVRENVTSVCFLASPVFSPSISRENMGKSMSSEFQCVVDVFNGRNNVGKKKKMLWVRINGQPMGVCYGAFKCIG